MKTTPIAIRSAQRRLDARTSTALVLVMSVAGGCAGDGEAPSAGTVRQGMSSVAPPVAHAKRSTPRQLDRHPRLYVPEDGPAARQAAVYRQAGRIDDAALMDAMAAQPQVVYLVGGTPDEVRARVEATIAAAERRRELPVFAAYNIPGRDCSQYSGGGAGTEAEYQAWIEAIARQIGRHHAVVLLEPDGVALPPSEPWCGEAGGGFSGEPEDLERARERFRELRFAVERLERQPQTDVYLDAGHSAWHPLNDYDAYYGDPELQFGIVNRLFLAGIEQAAGFFLNPSNYQGTESLVTYGTRVAKCIALLAADPNHTVPAIYEPNIEYDEHGDFASPCPPDEELDRMPLTPGLVRRAPHFVLDTSRNGQGPWVLGEPDTANDDAAVFAQVYGYETADPQVWCNAPGRGVGLRPSTHTGHPLVDAFLWIKVPGESDGQCDRGVLDPASTWPASYDVAWGLVDPPAGNWFEAQGLELARLAAPPLTP